MGNGRGGGEIRGHWMLAIAMLLLTQLSCRPLVTIGWGELVIFMVIAAIVVVPLAISLVRWLSGLKSFFRSPRRRRDKTE